jgi:hypothetical protein
MRWWADALLHGLTVESHSDGGFQWDDELDGLENKLDIHLMSVKESMCWHCCHTRTN